MIDIARRNRDAWDSDLSSKLYGGFTESGRSKKGRVAKEKRREGKTAGARRAKKTKRPT